MSVQIEKLIQAVWTCDWCFCTVASNCEDLPPDWEDNTINGNPSGGEHYCSTEHYILARNAWDDGFEAGLEAQAEHREKVRMEWMTKRAQGTTA